jgi:hypothetical protein
MALVAARPSLIDEVRGAPDLIRSYIAEQTRILLDDANLPELLDSHLNNAQEPAKIQERVRTQLEQLARLS